MRVAPQPAEIRQLVTHILRTLSSSPLDLANLNETVLLNDGRYAARSYRVDGFMAMWLVDAGIVQFYDAQGNMLRTVNLFEERQPQRVAA
ncbi:MAG: hypothetical protein A2W31_07370 [Planctomycetes bacterium RBG_16_64_10]|nr:MAG: hypothetical protein A2W31_07370 [Planctomycetes bacterium RBG_16_64_10]